MVSNNGQNFNFQNPNIQMMQRQTEKLISMIQPKPENYGIMLPKTPSEISPFNFFKAQKKKINITTILSGISFGNGGLPPYPLSDFDPLKTNRVKINKIACRNTNDKEVILFEIASGEKIILKRCLKTYNLINGKWLPADTLDFIERKYNEFSIALQFANDKEEFTARPLHFEIFLLVHDKIICIEMFMEFGGNPLSDILPASDPSTQLHILRKILKLLKFLEHKKFPHNDIKCENFLYKYVNNKIKLKLIDFDTATLEPITNNREKVISIQGFSRGFMAPEIKERISNSNSDNPIIIDPWKAQIYSVGVVMLKVIGIIKTKLEDLLNLDKSKTSPQNHQWLIESISHCVNPNTDSSTAKIIKIITTCMMQYNPSDRLLASDSLKIVKFLERKELFQIQQEYNMIMQNKNLLKGSIYNINQVEIYNMKNEIIKANQKISALEKDNSNMIGEFSIKNNKISTLENDTKNLNNEVNKRNNMISILEAENGTIKNEFKILNNKISILEAENGTIKNEFKKLNNKISLYEIDNNNMKKEFSKDNTTIANLEIEKNNLKNENFEKGNQIANLLTEKANLFTENYNVKNELITANKRITLLETNSSKLKNENLQNNHNLSVLATENEKMKNELATRNKEVSLLKDEKNKLEGNLRTFKLDTEKKINEQARFYVKAELDKKKDEPSKIKEEYKKELQKLKEENNNLIKFNQYLKEENNAQYKCIVEYKNHINSGKPRSLNYKIFSIWPIAILPQQKKIKNYNFGHQDNSEFKNQRNEIIIFESRNVDKNVPSLGQYSNNQVHDISSNSNWEQLQEEDKKQSSNKDLISNQTINHVSNKDNNKKKEIQKNNALPPTYPEKGKNKQNHKDENYQLSEARKINFPRRYSQKRPKAKGKDDPMGLNHLNNTQLDNTIILDNENKNPPIAQLKRNQSFENKKNIENKNPTNFNQLDYKSGENKLDPNVIKNNSSYNFSEIFKNVDFQFCLPKNIKECHKNILLFIFSCIKSYLLQLGYGLTENYINKSGNDLWELLNQIFKNNNLTNLNLINRNNQPLINKIKEIMNTNYFSFHFLNEIQKIFQPQFKIMMDSIKSEGDKIGLYIKKMTSINWKEYLKKVTINLKERDFVELRTKINVYKMETEFKNQVLNLENKPQLFINSETEKIECKQMEIEIKNQKDNSKFFCYGCYELNSHSKMYYSGEVVKSKAHGIGIALCCKSQDERIDYINLGQFILGIQSGFGLRFKEDKSLEYIGYFEHGKYQGYGIEIANIGTNGIINYSLDMFKEGTRTNSGYSFVSENYFFKRNEKLINNYLPENNNNDFLYFINNPPSIECQYNCEHFLNSANGINYDESKHLNNIMKGNNFNKNYNSYCKFSISQDTFELNYNKSTNSGKLNYFKIRTLNISFGIKDENSEDAFGISKLRGKKYFIGQINSKNELNGDGIYINPNEN